MSLQDRIERAREIAATSLDPADHRLLAALEAIGIVEQNRLLLAALTEEGPTDDIPPWSAVRQEGESEGPIAF